MHRYHTSSGTSSCFPTNRFLELKVEVNNCTPQKPTRQGAVENYMQRLNDIMSRLELRLTPRAPARQGAAEESMRRIKESMRRINDTKERQ